MKDLKYTEILKLNRSLGNKLSGEVYNITVLSNVITDQLNAIMEFSLRSEDINVNLSSGDYDNIVQDSIKYDKSEAIIIFWELANIIDGLQYKANLMNDIELTALVEKVISEIDFVISNLKITSLVLFNKFSTLAFNGSSLRKNNFDKVCDSLNAHLEANLSPNIFIVEIDKVIAKISIGRSVDFRYYYSSKSLYTIDFYKTYCEFVLPIIKSVKGKAKKALIFDCDNTLWKGILGEDGFDKIEMSSKTKSGVVFEEIQSLALDLVRRGVILGLCSKNNPEDVEFVLAHHSDISIRNENITIKKVNWIDKGTNLKAISNELNIGIDSLVFIDDSDFEVNYIKDNLSDVVVVQVPANLFEYPQIMRDCSNLFFNLTQSKEDLKKTEMYKQQAQRLEEKSSFNDIESYLRSLSLEITIHKDLPSLTPRISQLTQKTNQFNLTTRRYTEIDIDNFLNDVTKRVISFDVKDKYGDSGLTGVCILDINTMQNTASIDSLLMSCRVIGRNIEKSFFDILVTFLKALGIKNLKAEYIKSFKNDQVSNFYDNVGFSCTYTSEQKKNYELVLEDYKLNNIEYIKTNYGTEN
ncbi:FkbH-like protein [Pedobacter sp. UYP24]